jgi:GNAT superfamily N-acetyltransferase
MQNCTITKQVQIVEGTLKDYRRLSRFHYRDSRLGPFERIFTAKLGGEVAGVIVYSMPAPSIELRRIATNNSFAGFDRRSSIALLNKTVRTISRVIVEPRFRGLGLAVRLVRETMPLENIPMIEALAVMGRANPFFEKAGMKAFVAPLNARCVQMAEALSLVGLDDGLLVDAQAAQQHIENLSQGKQSFIEREMKRFVAGYGDRRNMPAGPERTQFVLSKLTDRPVYYLWLNPAFSASS